MKKNKNQTETVASLPEHGPIDENGKEILLEVKNVEITFDPVQADWEVIDAKATIQL